MAALIDDGGELVEELEKDAGEHDHNLESTAQENGEDYSDPNYTWMPDPLDAPPSEHFLTTAGSQLILCQTST